MRIEKLIHAKVTEDSDGLDGLWTPRAVSQVITAMERVTSGKFLLLDLETFTVPFGDIDSPRAIYIEAAGEIDVNLNGLGAITILPADELGTSRAHFFVECAVSSLTLTNNGADPIAGRWLMWGDPAV